MHINKISAKKQKGCNAQQACAELSPYYDMIYHESNNFVENTIEMVPKGCNKAVGIAAVCRIFHIAWEDTIVFGDTSMICPCSKYPATKRWRWEMLHRRLKNWPIM